MHPAKAAGDAFYYDATANGRPVRFFPETASLAL